MEEAQKNRIFYLILSKIGLLLIALGALRAYSIYQDALGFTLGLIGFWLIVAHIKFVEKKWGMSKQHSILSTVVFTIMLLPLAYWFASPF